MEAPESKLSPYLTIGMGAALSIAGASGDFVLVGTESGDLLVVVGALLACWGLIKLARSRRNAGPPSQP